MSFWFGEPWHAPVCDDEGHRAPVPVGEPCVQCEIAIVSTDRGMLIPLAAHPPRLLPYHLICFLATVLPLEMWPALREHITDPPPTLEVWPGLRERPAPTLDVP